MLYGIFQNDSTYQVFRTSPDGKPLGKPLSTHASHIDADEKRLALSGGFLRRSSPPARVQSLPVRESEVIGEITGYIAIWNAPGEVDAYGTWFDRSKPPDMALDFLPIPLCYEHGFDGVVSREIIGSVTNFFFDNTGIGFRGYLNRASKFYGRVLTAIQAGNLKTSSATAGHIADFDDHNRFVKWYLAELSLTESPAEYNMPIVTLVRSVCLDGGQCLISHNPQVNPQESGVPAGVNVRRVTPNRNLIRSRAMTALQQLLQAGGDITLEQILAALIQDGYTADEIMGYIQQMVQTTESDPAATLSVDEDEESRAGDGLPPDIVQQIAALFAGLENGGQDELDESGNPAQVIPNPATPANGFAPARRQPAPKGHGQRQLATRNNGQNLTPQQRRQTAGQGLSPQPRGLAGKNGFRTASNAAPGAGRQQQAPVYRVGSQFDRLSAADMALGAIMMDSAVRRGQTTANPLSDEYYRAMAYKTAMLIDAGDPAASDYAVVRSFPAEGRAMRRAQEIAQIDPQYIRGSYRANEVMNGGSGQGAEWIDELQGTTLWEYIRQDTPLYDRMLGMGMDEQELPQGFNAENIPLEGSDPTWYVAGGAASVDANSGMATPTFSPSKFGTGEQSVTVAKLSTAMFFQRELEEDSIINIVQEANRKLRISATEQIEYILINGDTATGANTNINLIDGTPPAAPTKPSYTLLNGLLKLALVTNTANARDAGAGFDDVDFLATLALLPPKYRIAREKLLFIMDSDTALAAANIPVYKTRDVYGKATLEEGNLMSVAKIDILESGQLGLANAAGMVSATPGNNIYGRVLLVRPDQWAARWKRRIQTDVFYDSYSDTTRITGHMRWGLAYRDNEAAAAMYNVPVTLS